MHKTDATVNVGGRGKMFIHKSNVIGTNRFNYRVWIAKTHGSIMEINGTTITCEDWTNGQWCYALRSRNLPKKIDDMPYGDARTIAVRAYHRRLDELCYRLITKAFPETSKGMPDMGDIVCMENSQ